MRNTLLLLEVGHVDYTITIFIVVCFSWQLNMMVCIVMRVVGG